MGKSVLTKESKKALSKWIASLDYDLAKIESLLAQTADNPSNTPEKVALIGAYVRRSVAARTASITRSNTHHIPIGIMCQWTICQQQDGTTLVKEFAYRDGPGPKYIHRHPLNLVLPAGSDVQTLGMQFVHAWENFDDDNKDRIAVGIQYVQQQVTP